MGEKIFDLISKIATGEKRRVFWATVIVVLIVFIIVFPYIDANFLYYSRMEKRLDNLSKLIEISGETINDSPELDAEYQSILEELTRARERTIFANITSSEEQGTDFCVKFVSGGFLFGVVGIVGLFTRNKKTKMTFSLFLKNNLTIFLACSLVAVFFAFIFSKIPTLGVVWVNAILSPVVQIVVLYLLMQPKKEQ